MSETTQQKGAVELVERGFLARQEETQNIIVRDDGTNTASIPGFPYIFEAMGDKILVAVDVYKSGYECKECKGTGKITSHCACEDSGRPGYKYVEPANDVQKDMKCPECLGDFISKRVDKECSECKGKGALIWIPDQSKSMPTTGVIVSVGSEVKNLRLKNHSRVLFGAYTGVMIPTKAPGVVFKVLRDIEVLCTIQGGEDMAVFDFVVTDKEL